MESLSLVDENSEKKNVKSIEDSKPESFGQIQTFSFKSHAYVRVYAVSSTLLPG